MKGRVLISVLFVCVWLCGNCESAETLKTKNVFYVLGNDGIYVIDPVEKRLVTKITNTTSPGLCTRSNSTPSRSPCLFSQASFVDNLVFVADASGSAVHVIDVNTQTKVESIPMDPHPYGLHYLPWLGEIWVHSWNLSTFDVIETEGRSRTHKAIRAHVKPEFSHGIMVADRELLDGDAAYVTHFSNPGIHKLNLQLKSYSDFLNLTTRGCTGTYGIAFSSYNKHLYVDCQVRHQSRSLLEIDVANDKIVKTWNFTGSPFVSPNGRYVVVLDRNASRMNILAVTELRTIRYPEIPIPGGSSHAVFYIKEHKPNSYPSYYAFVTLDYSDKMAVVDLDLASNGSGSYLRYIDDVGTLDTKWHGASRDLFIEGKWIISPATGSKAVVIINAKTQKVHGKVNGVNGGGFAVWVPGSHTIVPSGTSGIRAPIILMVLLGLFYCFLHL